MASSAAAHVPVEQRRVLLEASTFKLKTVVDADLLQLLSEQSVRAIYVDQQGAVQHMVTVDGSRVQVPEGCAAALHGGMDFSGCIPLYNMPEDTSTEYTVQQIIPVLLAAEC